MLKAVFYAFLVILIYPILERTNGWYLYAFTHIGGLWFLLPTDIEQVF